MRILHTADLHVGANRRFPNYLDRYVIAIQEILGLCVSRKVDVLVLAGDLLDSRNPTLVEKSLISQLVSKSPCPVMMIHGNHEWLGPNWWDTSLNWLFQLAPKTPQVKMHSEPTVEQWKGAWWVIIPPWKIRRVNTNWSTADVHLIATHLLTQIPKTNTKPVIGIAHDFFLGAVTDTGYQGTDKTCRLPKLSRIDYWALGDIHKHQRLYDNAWYCGSPLQTNFGEHRPKGVLIVDIGNPPEFVELKQPKPLLELHGVPRGGWPDAFIKLHCDIKDLPAKLPEDVVSLVQPSTPTDSDDIKEIHSIVSSQYLLNGMKPFLKKRGLPTRDVKRAMRFSKDLIDEIENKEPGHGTD